jgi:hypothetical protein
VALPEPLFRGAVSWTSTPVGRDRAAEQADEADEAFAGTVPRTEVPAHARAGQVGRGHRFAAYPRCSPDPNEASSRKATHPCVVDAIRKPAAGKSSHASIGHSSRAAAAWRRHVAGLVQQRAPAEAWLGPTERRRDRRSAAPSVARGAALEGGLEPTISSGRSWPVRVGFV